MSDDQEFRVRHFDLTEEVDRFFDESSFSTEEEPRFVLLMGGYGSGKTTARQERFTPGFVVLDAGEMFFRLCQDETLDFPGGLEEPLNIIGNWVARRAIKERRNIVTEIIGADEGSSRDLINAIKRVGFKLELVFVDCDPKTAWERNQGRTDDWISAHFAEPFHIRWLIEAATAAETVE